MTKTYGAISDILRWQTSNPGVNVIQYK